MHITGMHAVVPALTTQWRRRQRWAHLAVGLLPDDDRVPEVRPRLAREEARRRHHDALRQRLGVEQAVQHGERALQRHLADRRRTPSRPRREGAPRQALHGAGGHVCVRMCAAVAGDAAGVCVRVCGRTMGGICTRSMGSMYVIMAGGGGVG